MSLVRREKQYRLIDRTNHDASEFAREVVSGLTASRKTLPCRFFYDELGSRLFEEICSLPEYYLTRSEREILHEHSASIVSGLPPELTLVELGSGGATKTRLVIEALLDDRDSLCFSPIDVSISALETSADDLLEAYPSLDILAVAGEYRAGLKVRREEISGPQLVLWLGSSIGNLTRQRAVQFLAELAASLEDEDRLLIGIDLRKPASVLEPAYDDAEQVTARFNRNILERVNNELGGRFQLDSFRHESRYNEDEGRVEMHLVSERSQAVAVEDLDLEVTFREGETIHTENSYKYSTEEIAALADESGLTIEEQWFDREKRFSLSRMRRRK